MKRIALSLAFVCLLACLFPVNAGAEETTETTAEPEISAASAILVDADSGRILYEKNSDEKRMIASITKLMTALVAAEHTSDLETPVKIKAEWTGAEGSSIYLVPGETVTLKTLLYGLLLNSGNDAALAVAGFCAGDEDTFVGWMNQRALELGMTNTNFANPNGLNDEQHYSTAADMAKLAAACLKNKTVAKIVATKSISLEGRTFTNHNKLLWQYEGCIGLKTGYTELAGRTLVSAAQKNGQTLIAVTLDDPDDWKDHAALLDYGFEDYPQITLCRARKVIRRILVEGSLVRSVPVVVQDTIRYPFAFAEQAGAEIDLPAFVRAPVREGSVAGTITYWLDGTVIGTSYLLYGEDVNRDVVSGSQSIQRVLDFFQGKETFLDVFRPVTNFSESMEGG